MALYTAPWLWLFFARVYGDLVRAGRTSNVASHVSRSLVRRATHTPGQPRQERGLGSGYGLDTRGKTEQTRHPRLHRKGAAPTWVGSSAHAAPPPIVTFGNFHLHSPKSQQTNNKQEPSTEYQEYQQGKRAGCSGKESQTPFPRDLAPKGSCEYRRDEIGEPKKQEGGKRLESPEG